MSVQSTATETARAWVDIDLGALLRNAETLARHARVPLLPMVKADAYGLGALPACRVLETLNPFAYGVATVSEGRELRAAGIARPILVFTPILPGDFGAARDARITPVLGDPSVIAAWIGSGGGDWHLGIDTGMHRAGLRWDAIATVAELALRLPPAGACTHFHSAELDDGSMAEQERRFEDALGALRARPAVLHADNSAAIVRHGPSRWSVVRPGVFLYGVGSGTRAAIQPEPVAHLRARVVEIHELRRGDGTSYDMTWRARGDARVATLAIGYADGYRRSLGNAGTALIRGRRAPVAGGVTMDMTMVDVTAVPCSVGDIATLLGRDGDELLTAEDVGAACGLSPYEILTGLRQRAPRRYA